MQPLAHSLAFRFLAVFDGIIDNSEMRPSPGHGGSDTGGDVGSPAVCVPAIGGHAVRSQACLKYLSIFGAGDNVAHLATEVARQVAIIGRGDDVLVWVSAQIVSGKAPACEFRLAMPGRHKDHQAIELASLYGF